MQILDVELSYESASMGLSQTKSNVVWDNVSARECVCVLKRKCEREDKMIFSLSSNQINSFFFFQTLI